MPWLTTTVLIPFIMDTFDISTGPVKLEMGQLMQDFDSNENFFVLLACFFTLCKFLQLSVICQGAF